VLATVTDITERKRVERERTELLAREQEAHAEMARANRMKDEFLAVLSHELRTPLSSVLGYARLLEAGALSDEQRAHAVTVIRRNAEAQVRLVDSLLDLSSVMAGRLDLDVERVDLRDVVSAALDVTRPAASAAGLTMDVVLPDAPVWVEGDAGRLQQVFWNLLTNAIKFTPCGGRIALSAEAANGEASVTVSDTGQGIQADFLPHVFDRFSQAHARGYASRGLGLGLALVSEIVQAHGGRVKASSPGEGGGSTFEVRLPARGR
jgi:signal transduction histidine kinase